MCALLTATAYPQGMAWRGSNRRRASTTSAFADAAIENAGKYNLRIVWLWFASWKNGLSTFAPGWVKANQGCFPRV